MAAPANGAKSGNAYFSAIHTHAKCVVEKAIQSIT
jgi:hypothetical protein